MKDNYKTLKRLAIQEAKALKKHATKEEVNNLNIKSLSPNNVFSCIYGQMTGCCYSCRAWDLILLCCSKVYAPSLTCCLVTNSVLKEKPEKLEHPNERAAQYYSPIEKLILFPKTGKKNAKLLIDFIKGKSDTLKLV